MFLLIFSYNPNKTTAIDPVQPAIIVKKYETYLEREQYVKQLVDIYAKKYNVSSGSLWRTIKNENNMLVFNQQSTLKYKANNRWEFPEGTREKSFGLAQIHLPDHPKVSYEQAIDPEFSIEFMAKNFSLGRQSMWMGFSK